jgi:hypothetical protein
MYLFDLTSHILSNPKTLCRYFVAFSLPLYHYVHAFDEGLHGRATQQPFTLTASSQGGELALFESFTPKAIASVLEGQNLDLCTAPVDKDKPVTTARIFPQVVAYLPRQTIKGAPHVGRPSAQPDTPTR